MRVLAILERTGPKLVSHCLAYAGLNRTGEASFNGERRTLFLLAPGRLKELPEGGAGVVVPRIAVTPGYFLSIGEDFVARIEKRDSLSVLSVETGGFLTVSAMVEALRPISVGILTVSDKGSRGEREDRSGPALARCVRALGAEVKAVDVVPDVTAEITDKLENWSDELRLNLVLTTGGTGFARRDVTPEALSSVAEKHVPGIGEAMRSASMKVTPRGMLSRLCAVIRGETLIVALPGSEKASTECFAAIAPALRHGIEILCGWDSECGERPVPH